LQKYCNCNTVAIKNQELFSSFLPAISVLKCKFAVIYLPFQILSDILFAKILLMPPLIAGVTLAVRKWGEGWGGWIGGFPWVAGPISFFIALEHGAGFRCFHNQLCFARISRYNVIRAGICHCIGPTIMASDSTDQLCCFFIVALLSLGQSISIAFGVGLNLVVLTAVLYFFPKPKGKADFRKQPVYDIPLRMLAATFFVVAVTQAADYLGPTWSGILTPFPIMTSTLAVFTHSQQGSDAAIRILYGLFWLDMAL
jgi:hypothetical protein